MRLTNYIDKGQSVVTQSLQTNGATPKVSSDGKASERSWTVDSHYDCERPILIEHSCYDTPDRPKGQRPFYVDQKVACRKCPSCRTRHKKLWAARAFAQIGISRRTWFCTMTINEMHMHQLRSRARVYCATQGDDYDTLTAEQKFKEDQRLASRWLTLWLKRVRKRSSAKIKYLLVAERGTKRGRLHYHALVHELFTGPPLQYDHLHKSWTYGHSEMKLVTEELSSKVPWYVCKYISKDALARVRASARYGQTHLLSDTIYNLAPNDVKEGGKGGNKVVPPSFTEEGVKQPPDPNPPTFQEPEGVGI